MASFETKARASRQCHQQNHRRDLLSAGAASRRSQNALWCQSQRSCGRRGSVANKTQSATSTPWQGPPTGGGTALWHRSRQKRGHRDSVTNKTIGAVCSPQERRAAAAKTRCGVNRNVVAGDAAVLRTKLRARLPRPGRSPPTGGGTALWHRSRQKRGHRDSVTNKTIGAVCSPRERMCRGSVAKKIGAQLALRRSCL